MTELSIEEIEDILEEIGAFNHYSNVLSSISCLIDIIDWELSQEKADNIIKVIKENLLQQF